MNARTQCDAVASAQAGRVGRGWLIGTVWVIALLAAALPSAQAVEPPVLSSTNPTVPSTSTGDNSAVAPGSGAQTIATAARGSPAKRTHEGIQVHGHWTIEVRNPDGTLDKRVEFENGICHNLSLANGSQIIQGDTPLFDLMSGTFALAGWYIQLGNVVTSTPPPTTAACGVTSPGLPGADFTIVQTGMADPSHFCPVISTGHCFLSLSNPAVSAIPGSLTLSGQFLVPLGGATAITDVSTNMILCTPVATSPVGACMAMPTIALTGNIVTASNAAGASYYYVGYQFTGQYLAAPVQVADGQTVGVTVVISFN